MEALKKSSLFRISSQACCCMNRQEKLPLEPHSRPHFLVPTPAPRQVGLSRLPLRGFQGPKRHMEGEMLGVQYQPSAPSSSSAARAALHGQNRTHCCLWAWGRRSLGGCSYWHSPQTSPRLMAELWCPAPQLMIPPAGLCAADPNPLSLAVWSVFSPLHFPLI